MNGGAGPGFAPVLRALERRLALPLPKRVRFLRELEFDLQELAGRLVADGVPAEEARRQAVEALVPDHGALGQLDSLHATLYRRATRPLTPGRLRLMERGALAVLTAGILMGETFTLLQADLLSDPSPFLWPVILGGGALLAMVAAKAFQLWIKGDHTRPRAGLTAILGMCGGILALGTAGAMWELFQLAGALEAAPERVGVLVPAWLARQSVLMSVALILSLAGGLAWLVLSQWVASLSRARRELLEPDAAASSNEEE